MGFYKPDICYAGTYEDAALRTPLNKCALTIRQVLPAAPLSKITRKCIALPRTLNSACPGSVTLHPDVLRKGTLKKSDKGVENRIFDAVTAWYRNLARRFFI